MTPGDLHCFERKVAEISAYRNVEHYCNNVKGLKCMPDYQVVVSDTKGAVALSN